MEPEIHLTASEHSELMRLVGYNWDHYHTIIGRINSRGIDEPTLTKEANVALFDFLNKVADYLEQKGHF